MYACVYHVHTYICTHLSVPARGESNFSRRGWLFTARGVCELDAPLPGACWVRLLLYACVRGRWLKFAAFVLVQKQCVIRSFCRNGRWSCLCAIRVALCKSANTSAKEEKTASSIVQFECVSLLVRLTCQRSYPTSHSCTLKNSSDPGITFRSLTVARNIRFFLCEAWTTCSVL